MKNSLFQMAISIALFSTCAFLSRAQQVSGPSSVPCGAVANYSITVPGTIQSCQGIWTISYPNGNSNVSGGGSTVIVNWGSSPGSGTVAFSGWCTYIPNPALGNSNSGPTLGGGSSQPVTVPVTKSVGVTIGNGKMSKPYITGPGHFCVNQTKSYSISSVPNAVSYTYLAPSGWSINGGSNSLTTTALSVNLTSPSSGSGGNLFLKVRTNGPNCTIPSNYAARSLKFGAIQPSIVGSSVVSPNSYNEYFGVSTEGLVNGSWSKPSSWSVESDNGVASQVFQMSSSGTGTITLSGYSCGNYVQASRQVTISSGPFIGPKSLSTDSDVAEETEFQVTAYPNPSSDVINFETNGATIKRIILFDGSGRVVRSQQSADQMDISTLSGGLYQLSIENTDGQVIKSNYNILP